MIYIFLLLLTLGLYSASNKINQYIFKEKGNIIINTFIFSFFFGLIYLINAYLFLLNINSKYFYEFKDFLENYIWGIKKNI